MSTENIEGFQQQEESKDIRILLFKLLKYWPLFILTIFIVLVVAFLFNKYTAPIYEVSTTVLVKEDRSMMDASSMLGIGLSNSNQNVENEIVKLSSFSLQYRTIISLDFEVSYFLNEGLIVTELYHKAPFKVVFDSAISQAVDLKYSIVILNKDEFRIVTQGELIKKYNYAEREFEEEEILGKIDWKKNYRFGDLIENPYNSFKIILNNNFDPETDIENTYEIVFNDYYTLTGQFGGIEIEPVSREASILEIKFKHSNIDKATAFLNMLTIVYLIEMILPLFIF